MAEQTVTLQPGESKLVAFEAIPHEARQYQVSVDGLAGSFRAVGIAKFYMPPKMTISIWEHDILQWHYHEIRCTVNITNLGTASGTHTIRWEDRYDPPGAIWRSGSKTITLGPGESYKWSIKGDIDFSRTNIYTCELYGDWETDNYSKGVVVEGVPS